MTPPSGRARSSRPTASGRTTPTRRSSRGPRSTTRCAASRSWRGRSRRPAASEHQQQGAHLPADRVDARDHLEPEVKRERAQQRRTPGPRPQQARADRELDRDHAHLDRRVAPGGDEPRDRLEGAARAEQRERRAGPRFRGDLPDRRPQVDRGDEAAHQREARSPELAGDDANRQRRIRVDDREQDRSEIQHVQVMEVAERILREDQVARDPGDQAGHARANAEHEAERRDRSNDDQRANDHRGERQAQHGDVPARVRPAQPAVGPAQERRIEDRQHGRRAEQEHEAERDPRGAERPELGIPDHGPHRIVTSVVSIAASVLFILQQFRRKCLY